MIRNGYFVGTAQGKKSYDDVLYFQSTTNHYIIQFSNIYGFRYNNLGVAYDLDYNQNQKVTDIQSFQGNLILTTITGAFTGQNRIYQWNNISKTVENIYNNFYVNGANNDDVYYINGVYTEPPVIPYHHGFVPAVNPQGDTIIYTTRELYDGSYWNYKVKTSTWVVGSGAVSDYAVPADIHPYIDMANTQVRFNNTNDGVIFLNNTGITIYPWNNETGYGVNKATSNLITYGKIIAWHPDGRTFSVYQSNNVKIYRWDSANATISQIQSINISASFIGNIVSEFSPGGNAYIITDGQTIRMYRYTANTGISLSNMYTLPSTLTYLDTFAGFNNTGDVIFFLRNSNWLGPLEGIYAFKWTDTNGIGNYIANLNILGGDYPVTDFNDVFYGTYYPVLCPRSFRPLRKLLSP